MSSSSSATGLLEADAGRDMAVTENTRVSLSAKAILNNNPLTATQEGTYTWQQTSGPEPAAQRVNGGQLDFIASTQEGQASVNFTLTAKANGQTSQDTIGIDILPCPAVEGRIFESCLQFPFGPWKALESFAGAQRFDYFGDSGQVQWQTIRQNDNERIQVSWNADDPDNLKEDNGWFGFTIAPSHSDFSAYAQGAIEFGIRFITNTDPTIPFYFRLECGPGCRSDDFVIRPNQINNTWKKIIIPLSRFNASGLDLSKLTQGLSWPQWGSQSHQVTVEIDNVKFVKDYTIPTPDECRGTGNITYTLFRNDSPSDEEVAIYDDIDQFMTEAIAVYNCHTHLERALDVYYDPAVPTANAWVGSNRINFGQSRSTLTALHEFGHIFGAGTNNYKTWVVDGLVVSPRVNAVVQKILDDPNAKLNGDAVHIWPFGLNFAGEDGPQERVNSALVIEALHYDQLTANPNQ